MSWWVSLEDADGEMLMTRNPFVDGGTYAQGGTEDCTLNVTYNYGTMLNDYGVHPDNHLHGRKGSETAPALEAARHRLIADAIDADYHGVVEGAEFGCQDYFHDCPANAARAVSRLFMFAREHPDGIWRAN